MGKIRIVGNKEFINGEHFEKIKAIKTFRAVWNLGLKDAKEMVDSLQSSGMLHVELPFPSQDNLRELSQFRIQVHAKSSSLQPRLKNLLIAAIRAGELDLSEELLFLYKRYYTG